jgi:hypothetical protein
MTMVVMMAAMVVTLVQHHSMRHHYKWSYTTRRIINMIQIMFNLLYLQHLNELPLKESLVYY